MVIFGKYNLPHLSELKMHIYFEPIVQPLPVYLINIDVHIPRDICMRMVIVHCM